MKRVSLCAVLAWALAAGSALAQDGPPAPKRIELDAAARQAAEGINSFTVDLYKRSIEPGANLFISPASVSTAVGLAYRGARGTTADELRKVMHFDTAPEAYIAANGELLKALAIRGKDQELSVANALWIQQGMPLLPEFTNDLATHVGAGLERVDYRKDAEAARVKINAWVARSTRDRIQDLLHQGDVTEDTRAALINAIYWKGPWAQPFPARDTESLPFHLLDGTRVDTPLMQQRSNFQVAERGGVKAIQLPYASDIYPNASGRVSMVVLLPNSATGLPKLEEKLTAAELGRWIADLDKAALRETILTLPKMHLEWRNDLADTLKLMGATTAFGDDGDFSGMATIPYPGEVRNAIGLKIKKVIHQSWLDVDEKGSEAAAATAVIMDIVVSGMVRRDDPPPPFIFRADKPFLFLLRDRVTGVILFVGRFIAPPSE